MLLITKEEAQENLEPFFNLFNKSINQAWDYWLTGGTSHRMQNTRYRACSIWNDFLYTIKKQIDENNYQDIRYGKLPYLQGVFVKDKYFIRFKKGNKSYGTSNYPTQSALDYHDPEIDMFGGIVRLDLIYILSDDGVGIDKIILTQNKGKLVVWAIDITDFNVKRANIDFTHNDDKEVARKVIKPKKDIAQKEKVVND